MNQHKTWSSRKQSLLWYITLCINALCPYALSTIHYSCTQSTLFRSSGLSAAIQWVHLVQWAIFLHILKDLDFDERACSFIIRNLKMSSEKVQIHVTNLLVWFSFNVLGIFLLIMFCIVYCCEQQTSKQTINSKHFQGILWTNFKECHHFSRKNSQFKEVSSAHQNALQITVCFKEFKGCHKSCLL